MIFIRKNAIRIWMVMMICEREDKLGVSMIENWLLRNCLYFIFFLWILWESEGVFFVRKALFLLSVIPLLNLSSEILLINCVHCCDVFALIRMLLIWYLLNFLFWLWSLWLHWGQRWRGRCYSAFNEFQRDVMICVKDCFYHCSMIDFCILEFCIASQLSTIP